MYITFIRISIFFPSIFDAKLNQRQGKSCLLTAHQQINSTKVRKFFAKLCNNTHLLGECRRLANVVVTVAGREARSALSTEATETYNKYLYKYRRQ